PLREHPEDIPLLTEHFVKRFSRALGKHVHAVASDVLEVFQGHSWPGNVRELQSTVKAALLRAAGEALTLDCLPEQFTAGALPPPARPAPVPPPTDSLDVVQLVQGLLRAGESDIYRKVGQAVDRAVFDTVLRHVKGNQVQACEVLGIARSTLRA